MAHNLRERDSMISVGETPWHGLGKTLTTAPSSGLEALQLADMDWSVKRVGLKLDDGRVCKLTGSVSTNNDGVYGTMVREDTNEILGIVGPNYHQLQNRDMAKLFDPLIESGEVSIETCGSLYNGRRVWMMAKMSGDNLVIDNGDEVARYIMLAHGHDGQFAVRFGFTPIRVVCANTLSMAVTDNRSRLVRCLHTKSLEENLVLLRDGMKAAEGIFEMTAEQFRTLTKTGVSRADLREYARILVEAKKEERDWTKQQKTKIGKIVGAAMEGRGNHGRTWWDAYNGFTEYLTWEAGRKADKRLDNLWFGPAVMDNTRGLGLAMEMALGA